MTKSNIDMYELEYNFEKAFEEGEAAYQSREWKKDEEIINPYGPEDPDLKEAWYHGWRYRHMLAHYKVKKKYDHKYETTDREKFYELSGEEAELFKDGFESYDPKEKGSEIFISTDPDLETKVRDQKIWNAGYRTAFEIHKELEEKK